MTYELAGSRVVRLTKLLNFFVANDKALSNLVQVDLENKYFTEDHLYLAQVAYDDVKDLFVQFLNSKTCTGYPCTHPGA